MSEQNLPSVEETAIENETSYTKGRELETEFSVFLKRELGWQKVRVGAHLPGKMNRKGAAIDVIGEKLSEKGKRYHTRAINFLIITGGLFVLAIIWNLMDWGNGGIGLLIYAIIAGIVAVIFLKRSDEFNKENAWVECKNLKSKVNINHVDKSLRELKDYRESGDKEYKFEYHYFVSASGFVENALKYAIENNVICYEKISDGGFKKVGYWD